MEIQGSPSLLFLGEETLVEQGKMEMTAKSSVMFLAGVSLCHKFRINVDI